MKERIWHQHYDYSVQTEYRFPRTPVHDVIGLASLISPDKTAIHYYQTELTFWELRNLVARTANALQELGVKKGDRVGIHLPNIPEYIITYYAALSIGAIVVNFSPLYTPAELAALVKQTGLTAIVTLDMFMDNIRVVCKSVKIPIVMVASIFDFTPGSEKSTRDSLKLEKEWHCFSELLDACDDTSIPIVEIKPEDPAMIQFTGGTTGIPKGALLTHSNIVASSYTSTLWASAILSHIPREKTTTICALPFFHVYANILCLNWSMLNCATMYLIPRFEIDPFMDMIADIEHITFFPAVPTMINALVHHPKAKELQLAKKVKLLNSGGGPIPLELIRKIKKMGINYSEGWGMSETTCLGLTNPVLGVKKQGSIGIPMPGMDAKLVDIENGVTEVPQGAPGELLLKSPTIMKEYWDNPEKTADDLKDGWLSSGDIAIMDEDGYFYIVDRKKDMIIAGGYNIYPREVDEVLYQHPKILDAVSVGIPHEYRGETVKAYVVLEDGESATEDEIITFCKDRLAVYKVPKLVEFRKELPKSAVGKILRKILRDEEMEKQEQ